METKQLARTNEKPDSTIKIVNGNLQLQTIDDLWRLSKMFCASGLCPQNLDTPEKVAVVLQGGAELGFKPWQSLQILHVVNGRLGMEGSAMLAKIRKSGVCDYVTMLFEGKPYEDTYRAIVKSKRRNESVEYMTDFSVEDAKRAKLWGVKDNWNKYPKDMLTWRAVSRHARRYYTDEIWAMYTPDELEDIESVPLEETFEDAQTEATAKIESEQGSEPVEAKFEEKPELTKKEIAAEKREAKKTAKEKATDIKFLYHCNEKKCGLDFNEPRVSGTEANPVPICPSTKCLSKNIVKTGDEKPEFMKD